MQNKMAESELAQIPIKYGFKDVQPGQFGGSARLSSINNALVVLTAQFSAFLMMHFAF